MDTSLLVPLVLQSSESFMTNVDVTEEDIGAIELEPADEDARLLLMLSYRTWAAPTGALRLHVEDRVRGTDVGMSVDLMTWTLE